MRHINSLDALIPKTRQGILAAMLVRPEKEWYASEMARRTGVTPSSLQRELQDLTDAGILKNQRRGRMTFYQPNPDSPIFPELRSLLLKTAGLVDVLAGALKPLADKLQLVFVYGSMANATERSDSDVDLKVIGKISPTDLALPLRRARELLGRDPTVYTPAEFAGKKAAKDHVLSRVLTEPRLLVLGTEDDLGKASRN